MVHSGGKTAVNVDQDFNAGRRFGLDTYVLPADGSTKVTLNVFGTAPDGTSADTVWFKKDSSGS